MRLFRFKYIIGLFVISSWLSLSVAQAGSAPNVWDVLRSKFSLNHEVTQPAVQTEIRWLTSHPGYFQNLARSKPYIYHIINQINNKNLPGEIALLPLIESAYDPFAYSRAGAAGLWQLMPGTGKELGLKQDWWYDGRRGICSSTNAALNYLIYLNKYFHGDWLLAIAAYDSGEGTVSRAIKKSRQSRNILFWNLALPRETRVYVPRLLALAEIIKHPEYYKINLPSIAHTPYFEEVNIGSQIDLSHAAKLADIPYQDLIKLNPGFNRWATTPYKPFNLLIPTGKVTTFMRNLSQVTLAKRRSWMRHEVPPKSHKVVHIVQKGDTLQSLEKKYHVNRIHIGKWNQLNPQYTNLIVGTPLVIWRHNVG